MAQEPKISGFTITNSGDDEELKEKSGIICNEPDPKALLILYCVVISNRKFTRASENLAMSRPPEWSRVTEANGGNLIKEPHCVITRQASITQELTEIVSGAAA